MYRKFVAGNGSYLINGTYKERNLTVIGLGMFVCWYANVCQKINLYGV